MRVSCDHACGRSRYKKYVHAPSGNAAFGTEDTDERSSLWSPTAFHNVDTFGGAGRGPSPQSRMAHKSIPDGDRADGTDNDDKAEIHTTPTSLNVDGDDQDDSASRSSGVSDQDSLHMTINMLNQQMDEHLNSFDAKAIKSLKR